MYKPVPGCKLIGLPAVLIAFAAGCLPKPVTIPSTGPSLNYAQELPPGEKALRKIPPERYPVFAADPASHSRLLRSIDNSLSYLAAPGSEKFFPYLDITHGRAVATLKALKAALVAAGTSPVQWDALIREKFEVYQSVGAPRSDAPGYSNKVLFTGYFTPTYQASLIRQGAFQWPLYKRPADLVTDYNSDASLRRTADGSLAPYYTRQQIESSMAFATGSTVSTGSAGSLRAGSGPSPVLAGQELVWLASRWEAYVITIQGSARLRLGDGRIYEVGFAGTNGQPYVSPGKEMLADGVITRGQLSLEGLGRYFRQHPESMNRYLWLNPRTTFFAERRGGPFGTLNVPVTPGATIATDKEVYPRAMPAFVLTDTSSAGRAPAAGLDTRAFMLDQDAGGAIRAAGRCDIYLGVGESAGMSAGELLSTGELYYLAIKPEMVKRLE
jgi:membrane-bound lytic murein transglycosylase A